MAGRKNLSLQVNDTCLGEWICNEHINGNLKVPVGPICTLVPQTFHIHIPKDVLKSWLVEDEESAQKVTQKIGVADIPVITKPYTEEVYKYISENLTETGRQAVEKIHPWIINTLVDWANFDTVICTCPKASEDMNNMNNNEEEKNDKTPSIVTQRNRNKEEEMNETPSIVTQRNRNKEEEKNETPSIVTQRNRNKEEEKNETPSIVTQWNREAVLKLIELHTKYEHLLTKVGVKKKTVWEKISKDIQSIGYIFTGNQCEQKWKNITKTYRDTVDHNTKSGNDRKECNFFSELQEAYGYRPNVKPSFLMSSATNNDANSSNESACGSTSSTDIATEPAMSKSSHSGKPKKVSKAKRRSSDEIVDLLRDIHSDIQQDQKDILEHLNKQHQERMQNEEKKLNLMSKLIDKLN